MRMTLPKWQKNTQILLADLIILFAMIWIRKILPNSSLIIPVGIVILILNTLRLFFDEQMKKAAEWCIDHRYWIALIAFVLLVACKIHVSSVASYATVIDSDPSVTESVLFGIARPLRSDEYNVQLPYYFSQLYNNYQEISYQMSLSGQDMIIGYNSPVLSLTLIGKPFVWGYILLGNEYGLAWYYAAKIILSLLAAYEMCWILTKKKFLSVFGSLLVVFAPALQWFLSPHIFDVFFWAMVLFDVGYWFFMSKTLWKKILFTLLSISALTGFVLALFPSLQVPCGMLMLALLIGVLYKERKDLVFKKKDWIYVGAVILGVGIVLVPALLGLKDALMLLQQTEYPGSRVDVGGYGSFEQLFMSVVNPIFSAAEPGYKNECELATFNHYGVLLILYFPYLWYWMKKKKDGSVVPGAILFFALLIEGAFLLFVFPEWLAKITLLSYCNRMEWVFGFTASIFTIWMLSEIQDQKYPYKLASGAVVCTVYGVLYVMVSYQSIYPNYEVLANYGYYWLVPIALSVLFFLVFTRFRQTFYTFFTAWIVVSGMLVNPIVTGTAAVTDYPLVEAAEDIIETEPDAIWLTADSLQTQNPLLANGARVINAVNFYPDFDKWELIDPDGSDYEMYNRYAHMFITLTQEPTYYEVPQGDLIYLYLNPEDLMKWDVDYMVLKPGSEEVLQESGISYDVLYRDNMNQDTLIKING